MLHPPESQTYNSYQIIHGGRGGPGGAGSAGGQGGGGYFTMNLVMPDHRLDDERVGLPAATTLEPKTGWSDGVSRELTGAMRNPGTVRSLFSPTSFTDGFNDQNPSSGSQNTFYAQTSSMTFPPFRLALPSSDPPFPHPLDCRDPFKQIPLTDFSTGPYPNSHSDWGGHHSLPVFEHRHHVPPDGAEALGSDSRFESPPHRLQADPLRSNDRPFITVNHHREAGIHILHRAVALEALYDSAESFPQPKCHPETRTELLSNLYHWATDPDSRYSIRWLHGPAGAGKSAVMQTLCRRLQDAGRLGGSFFFKRAHKTRGNAEVLFATLAYQLAQHQDKLKGPILQSMERDLSVLGRGMDAQLRTLILDPCKSFRGATHSVLLIDGLDECEGHNIQREILRLIGSTAEEHCLVLRILLASRPEPHIREIFQEEHFRGVADSTNIEQSFDDIRTYLRDEFSRIHREHSTTVRSIPTPWPSSQILEMLVRNSSVIKFIDDEYHRPSKRLDIIRNLALDQLYLQSLLGVPAQFRSSLCDILSVIINYPGLTVEGLTNCLVSNLGRSIQVHHASFRDFLNNQHRSSIFYIGSRQHHAKLARIILKALAYAHHDPQENRADPWFRWYITLYYPSWIQYIASVTPSADFVPLVRLINPDFVFCRPFLFWLKEIHPLPEDLIHRWEDYRFMHLYEHFEDRIACSLIDARDEWAPERPMAGWAPSVRTIHALRARMNSGLQATIEAFQKLLSQSPHLIRFLQAQRLLSVDWSITINLFQIRIALDLSWDDVRECICSLRPLITEESDFLYSYLAGGFIRLMQRIENGDLPMMFWSQLRPSEWHIREWGRHIRSSPQSHPELLRELHQFIPPWDVFSDEENRLEPVEFYDVVQWLKVSYHELLTVSHDFADIPQPSTRLD
ncbi:hypothetical protein B0H13DRAFT_2018805 [Mycena leptocephala]|nr:hypothetical protein B0H13DRAFT_2018805 [Mycena leptocephala]